MREKRADLHAVLITVCDRQQAMDKCSLLLFQGRQFWMGVGRGKAQRRAWGQAEVKDRQEPDTQREILTLVKGGL